MIHILLQTSSCLHMRRTALCLVCTALLVPQMPCDPAMSAEVSGDLGLLRLLASTYRANLDRLASWHGQAQLTSERRTGRAGSLRTTEWQGELQFWYDKGSDRVFWQLDYLRFKRVDEEGTSTALLSSMRYLRCDGFVYELSVPKGAGTMRAIRQPASGGVVDIGGSGIYSLMTWLVGHPVATDEWARAWVEEADQADGKLTITRKQNTLFVRYSASEERYLDEQTFDLEKGGLLKSQRHVRHLTNEKLTFRAEVDAVQRDAVWVPNTVRIWDDRELPDESHAHYVVALQTNEVNAQLPAERFSLAALGLRPGDKVFDSSSGATSTYQGEPAPAPPRSLARDAPVAARRWWLHAVWIAPPAVVLAVIAWHVLRRWRPQPQ